MMSNADEKMDKILEQITEIKVSCAVTTEKMKNISDRIEVINHNSTELTNRVSAIEGRLKTGSDYRDFVKKLGTALCAGAAFVATIATILHLLGMV